MRPSRDSLFRHFAVEPVLGLARARLRGCVVSLMYHEVLPDRDPREAWTVVRESRFHAQMHYLKQHYDVLGIDQALERMRHGGGGRPMALVTFDDGYQGNRNFVWPIVEELQLPITIFVATSAVQTRSPYWYDRVIVGLLGNAPVKIDLRPHGLRAYLIPGSCRGEARWIRIQRVLADLKRLSPEDCARAVEDLLLQTYGSRTRPETLELLSIDDIRTMAESKYVTFGAHSHDHDNLTQLEPVDVRRSVLQSKSLLEDWTGRTVRHFAYPFGAFNPEVARIVHECGFVSSQATTPGFWRRGGPVFAIPRVGIGRFESFRWFKARISGLDF
jgi:peptidoglycan/xylan/chitin deacetylase (PgdA/CDA1 family)